MGIYAGSCDLRSDVGVIHETIHGLIHYNWDLCYLSKGKKRKGVKKNSQASPTNVIISLGQPLMQLATSVGNVREINERRGGSKKKTCTKVDGFGSLDLTQLAQSASKIRSSYCTFII